MERIRGSFFKHLPEIILDSGSDRESRIKTFVSLIG